MVVTVKTTFMVHGGASADADLGFPVVEDFDFAFGENGLTAYKLGKALATQSFIKFLGEERYKPLVNFILHYIADLDIPIKRCVTSHPMLQLPTHLSQWDFCRIS